MALDESYQPCLMFDYQKVIGSEVLKLTHIYTYFDKYTILVSQTHLIHLKN